MSATVVYNFIQTFTEMYRGTGLKIKGRRTSVS